MEDELKVYGLKLYEDGGIVQKDPYYPEDHETYSSETVEQVQ